MPGSIREMRRTPKQLASSNAQAHMNHSIQNPAQLTNLARQAGMQTNQQVKAEMKEALRKNSDTWTLAIQQTLNP